ncbi:MAG: DUF3299 domain-containing protein [Alteromonadaceae bacterium]|nr:DUF3299 domain-containing protein [Alteromonadaceae bacterium]
MAVADNAETIKWVDLIPEKERELLANPPQSLGEIPDGSPADKIAGKLKAGLGDPDSAYHQALVSTNVVDTLRGKLIRIPGFIVPLEFTDDDKIKRFFLVPYFGACLHYPPPPPNQIIYAENADGIEFTFDPVWSTGYLQVSLIENDVATAAYHLKNIKVEVYD